jgi:Ca-activated chloride channel homolog
MSSMELFHFLRPLWLLLLPVLIVLLWVMAKRRLSSRSWEAICDENLLPHVLIGGSTRARQLPIILIGLGGLIAIISLAGPAWDKFPQPVFNNQLALVIALDLSHSMDSNDISPSRLSRARFKVADILNQHGEGQVALLVYAGDAFTVTPLTDDMDTIASQLPALTTSIMPGQGNRTDLALTKAEELLKGAGNSVGDILLITDEIDLEKIDSQARRLNSEGYRISVLGIGTQHGAPVVLSDGSFLKDKNGEIVIPVLDASPMQQLAQLSGGSYRLMTPDDSDIQFLIKRFRQNVGTQTGETSEFETDIWQEQGPWLLLMLLPLAAFAFRRGYLVVLFIFLIPIPDTAQAFDWESLWLRADQRAMRELNAGNSQLASELFVDPGWKGAAQYKAGDFQASIDSLENNEDLENLYNKGNALARMAQYEEAISTYEQVLEQMPEHEDALHNKTLLEEELKKQQQQDQEQEQQSDDQQKQDNEQQDQDKEQEQKQGDQDQKDQQEDQDNQQQDKQDSKQGEGSDKENGESQQEQENQEQQADDKKQEQQMTPEEKKDQEAKEAEAEKKKQEQKQAEKQSEENKEQLADAQQEKIDEEKKQATEQWLRRIPDDPAGLLRRKFRYQYQQRQSQQSAEEKKW